MSKKYLFYVLLNKNLNGSTYEAYNITNISIFPQGKSTTT